MTDPLDPASTNAFISAVGWLERTLLGTVAIDVAIIAVASIGFLMLTGRIDLRRAAHVVFGCFIIFGASNIAHEIVSVLSGSGSASEAAHPPPQPPALPQLPDNLKANATRYDPYAGAASPPR
jgi:type IV secretory pathway VirB2 component (pilin)